MHSEKGPDLYVITTVLYNNYFNIHFTIKYI